MTKSILTVLAAIFLFVCLFACAQLQTVSKPAYNLGAISAYTYGLSEKIKLVKATVDAHPYRFTKDELKTLHQAFESWDYIAKRLEASTATGITAEELQALYQVGKETYINCRNIVKPKLDEMPIEDQMTFISLDMYAKRLDQAVTEFKSDPNSDTAMKVGKFLLELANIALIIAPKVAAVI